MVEGGGRSGGWRRALGPGVLFTGAAVGVSHLVQSTRAGAVYGFALVLVVVAANLLKYPAFRFGPHYAAATHTSLLEGYRRQGRWALAVYGLLTLGTMFTVLAAVTLVTAGIASFLFGIDLPPVVVSAVVLLLCGALVAVGRYHWLDRISKVVVSVLALSTLVAVFAALPTVDWGTIRIVPSSEELDPATMLFVAALVGWMPSAIDVSVWQSLWTLAREKDTGHRPTLQESSLDFHLGYWGTALLAVCFLALGAAVMHGRGIELDQRPAVFASQIVDLYASTLGEWSRPVIGTCALLTMFSTTLTVVDGFPRALSVLVARFRGPEQPGGAEEDRQANRNVYWVSVVVAALGALAVLQLLLAQLKTLVDVATTLSFLTAPILAWLNHRAVLGPEVPTEMRPARWLIVASWVGIIGLGGFALLYLVLITKA